MTEFLRDWIMSLVGAAVISAAAMSITPNGRAKKTVRVVCGIVTIMAILSPLGKLEIPNLEDVVAGYRQEALAVSSQLDEVNKNIQRSIIESETASYISDKGKNLGMEIESVTVTAKMREDGYYYPYSASVTGAFSETQKRDLSEYAESQLGIETDNIVWRNTNE